MTDFNGALLGQNLNDTSGLLQYNLGAQQLTNDANQFQQKQALQAQIANQNAVLQGRQIASEQALRQQQLAQTGAMNQVTAQNMQAEMANRAAETQRLNALLPSQIASNQAQSQQAGLKNEQMQVNQLMSGGVGLPPDQQVAYFRDRIPKYLENNPNASSILKSELQDYMTNPNPDTLFHIHMNAIPTDNMTGGAAAMGQAAQAWAPYSKDAQGYINNMYNQAATGAANKLNAKAAAQELQTQLPKMRDLDPNIRAQQTSLGVIADFANKNPAFLTDQQSLMANGARIANDLGAVFGMAPNKGETDAQFASRLLSQEGLQNAAENVKKYFQRATQMELSTFNKAFGTPPASGPEFIKWALNVKNMANQYAIARYQMAESNSMQGGANRMPTNDEVYRQMIATGTDKPLFAGGPDPMASIRTQYQQPQGGSTPGTPSAQPAAGVMTIDDLNKHVFGQ